MKEKIKELYRLGVSIGSIAIVLKTSRRFVLETLKSVDKHSLQNKSEDIMKS